MVDISITAANVVAGSNSTREGGIAGETITAGQAVYLASGTKKWMKADNNAATEEARRAKGVALNGASLNQPIDVHTFGDITIGATLTAGSAYYLSDTPGGLCLIADIGTGEYVCQLGIAKSTTVLAVDIQYPGVAL